MREIHGNLWDYFGKAAVGITTGGQLSRKGVCLMLRGCARQAKERFPGLAEKLGALVDARGNHVYSLGEGLFSFPVENSPFEVPEHRLIDRSCRELVDLADAESWTRIVLPRPGCGTGGLEWPSVRPILERYLDHRFLIISP